MTRGLFRRDYNLYPRATHPLYYFCQWFSRLFFVLYCRREVYGRHILTKQGGGVLVANHASFLDPPLAGEPWPRALYYFARDTLFAGKWLTALMNICRCIPVRRGQNDIRALRRAVSSVEAGHVVLLFPEGTRSEDGRLRPGRAGAGMIAYKARARIFPCYIEGSWKLWSRGRSFPRSGKIRVFYGHSFIPKELYALPAGRDTYHKISALMMERIARLRRKAQRLSRARSKQTRIRGR